MLARIIDPVVVLYLGPDCPYCLNPASIWAFEVPPLVCINSVRDIALDAMLADNVKSTKQEISNIALPFQDWLISEVQCLTPLRQII